MQFLDLPENIRKIIYSHLFVKKGIVKFVPEVDESDWYDPKLVRITRLGRTGLDPAILRVNKTVNREASPFLYSKNRFGFYDVAIACRRPFAGLERDTYAPLIASWLKQIGANAALLRHIRTHWPRREEIWRQEYLRLLHSLREACPNLKIVEMYAKFYHSDLMLLHLEMTSQLFKTLDDGGFKDLTSLEKIVILREEMLLHGKYQYRDALMERMPSSK